MAEIWKLSGGAGEKIEPTSLVLAPTFYHDRSNLELCGCIKRRRVA